MYIRRMFCTRLQIFLRRDNMTVREKYEITEVGILSKYACTSIDETGSKREKNEDKCPYSTSALTADTPETVRPSYERDASSFRLGSAVLPLRGLEKLNDRSTL